ncbi:MAG: hypothetical protein QOC66_1862 [Pseudonocardiales bacterium]|nr:hypothetical protein [Pseudonocardiales bacterium]
MQYEITLPADYDMDIIRHRVATRGNATDDFPGLGLKAYLMREKGVHGSPVNQYAPFYLWADPAGMDAFLLGPGFAGLSADFGRPAVQHGRGLAFAAGPDVDADPVAATRSITPWGAERSLADVADAAAAAVEGLGATPGVHSVAAAYDPTSWRLVLFTLWTGEVPVDASDRYQVLHLSRPHLEELPRGRQQ